jgi:uncharacterized damage-inducible protein DinB
MVLILNQVSIMKKGFEVNELLNDLNGITQSSVSFIQKKISRLSDHQLNWRPNMNTWSLNDILAHLNSYAHYYHPIFKKKIEGTKFKTAKEKFVPSPLGKSAWKSMKLGRAKNIKRKFKAPKPYNPRLSTELLEGNQIEIYLQEQNKFLSILDQAQEVNLKKVKVPISISKIIRLRLGDALMFVTYHNERHIQQAANLMEHRGFPKK